MPQDEKRTTTITVKLSEEQKKRIEELATECDMTVSSYTLARAFNYQPKARLTEEQHETMKQFLATRSDVTNYANALNALSSEERLSLFRQYKFMLEWGKTINNVMVRLSKLLDKLGVPNPIPSGK